MQLCTIHFDRKWGCESRNFRHRNKVTICTTILYITTCMCIASKWSVLVKFKGNLTGIYIRKINLTEILLENTGFQIQIYFRIVNGIYNGSTISELTVDLKFLFKSSSLYIVLWLRALWLLNFRCIIWFIKCVAILTKMIYTKVLIMHYTCYIVYITGIF